MLRPRRLVWLLKAIRAMLSVNTSWAENEALLSFMIVIIDWAPRCWVLWMTLSLWCEIGWIKGSPVSSSLSLQCASLRREHGYFYGYRLIVELVGFRHGGCRCVPQLVCGRFRQGADLPLPDSNTSTVCVERATMSGHLCFHQLRQHCLHRTSHGRCTQRKVRIRRGPLSAATPRD